MEQYRTEEEQVAALKKWWADNGRSTVTGIALAVALVFGWKAYQNSVEQTKSAASAMYQQMLETALAEQPTDESRSSTKFIANKLKSDFDGTEYAVFASLYLAKSAVSEERYDDAEKELQWALANSNSEELSFIINSRIAKVQAANGKIDEALAILSAQVPVSIKPLYAEARGDILIAKGDREGAKSAYIEAAKAGASLSAQRPLLGMKLADVGVLLEDL